MSKSIVSNLKEGDKLSEIQYYTVKTVSRGTVVVENSRGFEFSIGQSIIEEGSFSAHQYDEEVTMTRTELIEVFANAGETVFTANFNKKPDAKSLKAKFNDPETTIKTNVAMEKLLLGDERTMIGYLVGKDEGTGRFKVVDLEDSSDFPKQVDPRTLNWLILRNVKYQVK